MRWVSEYNTTRPHQAHRHGHPGGTVQHRRARAEEDLLPLRLPAVLALAAAPPPPPAEPPQEPPQSRQPAAVPVL